MSERVVPSQEVIRLIQQAQFPLIGYKDLGHSWEITEGDSSRRYTVSSFGKRYRRNTNGLHGLLKLEENSGNEAIIVKGIRVAEELSLQQRVKALINEGKNLRTMEQIGGYVPHVRGFALSQNGLPLMLMDEVKGINAEDECMNRLGRMKKPLPLPFVARVMEPVMHTLDLAHAHNMVYGDVTPANIQITKDGNVILLDWEAARPIGAVMNGNQGNEIFSADFADPQVSRIDFTVDQRYDIYSVATTLAYLITGKLGSTPNKRINKLIRPYYPELAQVLSQAVHTDDAQRYKTIGEFRQALRKTELYRKAQTDEDEPDMPSFEEEGYTQIIKAQLATMLEKLHGEMSASKPYFILPFLRRGR